MEQMCFPLVYMLLNMHMDNGTNLIIIFNWKVNIAETTDVAGGLVMVCYNNKYAMLPRITLLLVISNLDSGWLYRTSSA